MWVNVGLPTPRGLVNLASVGKFWMASLVPDPNLRGVAILIIVKNYTSTGKKYKIPIKELSLLARNYL